MTPKPILVTGSHRSGSTWVGKMIAASPDVVYIQEPFNINSCPPGIYHKQFENWFTYIGDENESQYIEPITKTMNLQSDIISVLQSQNKPTKSKIGEVRRFLAYQVMRLQGKRVLLKDPIALFSAEWLARRFDMQVIILIRHPAAFVASLKTKNWSHPFEHFINQPLLMDQYLPHFRNEIEAFAAEPPGIIDQACLLWRIIYYMVHTYQTKEKNWKFIRHEDISRNPIEEFQNIFNYLNLEYTPNIRRTLFEHTQASNSPNTGIKRDSLSNIHTWMKRLSSSEIDYIREKVSDISKYYYSDEDWT